MTEHEQPSFETPTPERIQEIRVALIEAFGSKALFAYPPNEHAQYLMTVDGALAASVRHFAKADIETGILPTFEAAHNAAQHLFQNHPERFQQALRAGLVYQQSLAHNATKKAE